MKLNRGRHRVRGEREENHVKGAKQKICNFGDLREVRGVKGLPAGYLLSGLRPWLLLHALPYPSQTPGVILVSGI